MKTHKPVLPGVLFIYPIINDMKQIDLNSAYALFSPYMTKRKASQSENTAEVMCKHIHTSGLQCYKPMSLVFFF